MPEITRLSRGSDWTDLDFVERERTPRSAMKLGIQLHVAGLSLSNTISVLDELGVQRSRTAVHDWVQKTGLQYDGGASTDHVALDESLIRINDQQYRLYAVTRSRRLLVGERESRSRQRCRSSNAPVPQYPAVFDVYNGIGRDLPARAS
jgi:hypothetical protein